MEHIKIDHVPGPQSNSYVLYKWNHAEYYPSANEAERTVKQFRKSLCLEIKTNSITNNLWFKEGRSTDSFKIELNDNYSMYTINFLKFTWKFHREKRKTKSDNLRIWGENRIRMKEKFLKEEWKK